MNTKINFTAVMVRTDLFDQEHPWKPMNLGKDLGNLIYFNAADIEVLRFGERLFDADGELEVSDKELDVIRRHVPMLKAWAQEAILKIIGE